MPFDFSQFTTGTQPPLGVAAQPTAPAASVTPPLAAQPTATYGALPPGITTDDINQMWNLQNNPVTDPNGVMNTDSEGNITGSFQDLDPDAYKAAETQWQEQQKLQAAGILGPVSQSGGADGSPMQNNTHFGDAVPASFVGHDNYVDTPQGTPEGQATRVTSTNVPGQTDLYNKDAVFNDPNWGSLTTTGNINQHTQLSDTLFKYAPLAVAAFAGAAPLMFGDLAAAGGATAGGLAGDATSTGAYGGAASAAPGNAFSGMPSWLQNAIPNTVKSGITTLGNGGDAKSGLLGAAEGLGGAAIGASGLTSDLPSWASPVINAGIGLAKGGTFDFSKFIGPGLNLASKIGT